MNASIHAKLSCKSAGTDNEEDFNFFYRLHDFMDCSKEVEPSNLHRILTHHHWFIKKVAIPVFGGSYKTSQGRNINIKDDLEFNHVCADFGNKYIPSLTDYVVLIKDDDSDQERFESFQKEHKQFFFDNPEINDFMLSPLANTGMLKSLWVTHNSWMIGEILPKIFPKMVGKIKIKSYDEFSPSIMFNRMEMKDWINNGRGEPPSFAKINEYRKNKRKVITI